MAIPVSDEQTEKRLTDNPETDKSPVMSPNDRKFMDRLVEFMEKNMDNGELIVDDFCARGWPSAVLSSSRN